MSSRAAVRALLLIPCLLISWGSNRIRFCFGHGGLLLCYLGVSVIDVTISELNVLTFHPVALQTLMLRVKSGIHNCFGSDICTDPKSINLIAETIFQFPLTDKAALANLQPQSCCLNKLQTRVYLHQLFHLKEWIRVPFFLLEMRRKSCSSLTH